MNRFYIAPQDWNIDALELTAGEAHHCVEVLRLKAGNRIVVFNGEGSEATMEILEATRRLVTLKRLLHTKTPPVSCRITLAQAIPKGKNMELIIQKATELGAAAIAPILSERTVIRLDAKDAARKVEKWRKVVVDAGKQCGQNNLPVVSPVQTLKQFLTSATGYDLLLIASLQDDARTFKATLAEASQALGHMPQNVMILIGPEGDFTPAEANLARSCNCRPVTLGPIVLRTETASLYSLSVLGNALF